MGAAIRFRIADPVPVDHRIGARPIVMIAKVMNLGRRRLAAPSTTASTSSDSDNCAFERLAFSNA
jgi:hypothetical protein